MIQFFSPSGGLWEMTEILTCRVSFPQLFMFIMFIIKFEA